MTVYIKNHKYHYETENLVRLFFPNEKLEMVSDIPDELSEPYIYTCCSENDSEYMIGVGIKIGEYSDESARTFSISDENDAELNLAMILYDMLVKFTGIVQPWGLLTGVRPVKLLRKLTAEGGADFAVSKFRDKFRVSEEKIALITETERNERKIIELSREKSFSLYISIPFCPSRCSYCSFVSASVEKTSHLIEPYVELLCREIKETAEYSKRYGLYPESVYMGGGTPTTLTAEQMSKVLGAVTENFDLSQCREFTVEAGRPDTITEEKLRAIAACGVDRISINPQTLNDEVLKTIGRRHTAKEAIEAFELARKCGFNHINTDLIVGLPGDTLESFISTLDRICELDPESITVHTLSMKRASTLTRDGKSLDAREAILASDMLSYASKKLHACGYAPYYLYRQSRMVGNLENTGWSKPHNEGIYNVFIMDETHTILACGAGAVTKLKDNRKDCLERIFNFKYPYEYIDRFNEISERKKRIGTFYDEYN